MTDKEPIIIDGVNVKDCRRRIGKNSYCRYFKRLCSDNNVNCVWKQLARKTQECENYKKRAVCFKDVNKQLGYKYLTIKQKCEELKDKISKLQLNEYHYKNELKKHKKGIHKYRNLLKYEINDLRLSRREFLKMVGRYPKFEKDNIKLALDTFNRKLELIDNPSRYRKALEEIEKYCNSVSVEENLYNSRHFYNGGVTVEVVNEILNIINKAKGGGNAV